MGLDMYMYRCTKPRFEARKNYLEQRDKLDSEWSPKFDEVHSKYGSGSEEMAKLSKEYQSCVDSLRASYFNGGPGTDGISEDRYWRKFNALHGFIVREFADGVDECQTILIGGKKGVKKILDALRATKKETDDGATDADELTMPPTGGFFFGSTDVDDYFKEDVVDSIEYFENLYNTLKDDEVVFYEASW